MHPSYLLRQEAKESEIAVDRWAVLLQLYENESAFIANKLKLFDCYLECYSHCIEPGPLASLAQRMADLIGQRPRLDLDAGMVSFAGNYQQECSVLHNRWDFVRDVIETQRLEERYCGTFTSEWAEESDDTGGLQVHLTCNSGLTFGTGAFEFCPSLKCIPAILDMCEAYNDKLKLLRAIPDCTEASQLIKLESHVLMVCKHVFEHCKVRAAPFPDSSYGTTVMGLEESYEMNDPIVAVLTLARAENKLKKEEQGLKKTSTQTVEDESTLAVHFNFIEALHLRKALLDSLYESTVLHGLHQQQGQVVGLEKTPHTFFDLESLTKSLSNASLERGVLAVVEVHHFVPKTNVKALHDILQLIGPRSKELMPCLRAAAALQLAHTATLATVVQANDRLMRYKSKNRILESINEDTKGKKDENGEYTEQALDLDKDDPTLNVIHDLVLTTKPEVEWSKDKKEVTRVGLLTAASFTLIQPIKSMAAGLVDTSNASSDDYTVLYEYCAVLIKQLAPAAYLTEIFLLWARMKQLQTGSPEGPGPSPFSSVGGGRKQFAHLWQNPNQKIIDTFEGTLDSLFSVPDVFAFVDLYSKHAKIIQLDTARVDLQIRKALLQIALAYDGILSTENIGAIRPASYAFGHITEEAVSALDRIRSKLPKLSSKTTLEKALSKTHHFFDVERKTLGLHAFVLMRITRESALIKGAYSCLLAYTHACRATQALERTQKSQANMLELGNVLAPVHLAFPSILEYWCAVLGYHRLAELSSKEKAMCNRIITQRFALIQNDGMPENAVESTEEFLRRGLLLGNLFDAYFTLHFQSQGALPEPGCTSRARVHFQSQGVLPEPGCTSRAFPRPWVANPREPGFLNPSINVLTKSEEFKEALELTEVLLVPKTRTAHARVSIVEDSVVHSIIHLPGVERGRDALLEVGESGLPLNVRFIMYALALSRDHQKKLLATLREEYRRKVHTHAYANTHIRTYEHTRTHTHTHTYIHTHTHTHRC
jgi:hypothetical protein